MVSKEKILEEIDLIPDSMLAEVYTFIHYFRLGLEKSHPDKKEHILAFAGSWKDLSDDTFDEVMKDIKIRRRNAFSRRRNDGRSFD